MAMYVRAVKLPNMDLISVEAIASVKRFEQGVGLLNFRDKMIGWLDVTDKSESDAVMGIFDKIINDRRRASQPDWTKIITK